MVQSDQRKRKMSRDAADNAKNSAKTQSERFMEEARKLTDEGSEDRFRVALRRVATAKPKQK